MNQINFLEKPKISLLSFSVAASAASKYLKVRDTAHLRSSFNKFVFAAYSSKEKQTFHLLNGQIKNKKTQTNKLALINYATPHLKTNNYIFNHRVDKKDFDKKDLAKKNCFWNQCFDKSRLKNFVLWFLLNHGEYKTMELVEQLKNLGFNYATKAGISLGIDDLKIPPKKADLMFEAERLSFLTVNQYKRGEITGVERFQRLIDTWHNTSERLKQEVIDYFEATDILNPVYMMAFSGARGNISQVRQLVGMRGLMANPQGQIIDFPIRSNFREGLTLTEYIISSYGARKGIVDTALRTANAGYLTRRLVDVAQHVIISSFDCKTSRGIFLTDMKEGNKTIYSLQNRLVGRVLAKNIYCSPQTSGLTSKKNRNNKKEVPPNNLSERNNDDLIKDSSGIISSAVLVAKRNSEISLDLAFEISKVSKKVFVRSALTCQTKKLVCQLCYGWSLAQGNLVSIGEAVGVVAAQSIGEPGTQLTMRTFHTGGVFSGDVTDQIKAPFDGFVEYLEPIAGELIRTPEGKIAFLTKNEGSFILKKLNSVINDETTQSKKYKIPSYTLIFKRMGEPFIEREVIAQISSISRQKNATDDAELTIKSEMEGQFYGQFLHLQENKIGPKLKKKEKELLKLNETLKINSNIWSQKKKKNSYLSKLNAVINKFPIDTIYEAWDWGYAWILSGKIYQLSFPSSFFPIFGDFVNRKTTMNQTKWRFHGESATSFLELNSCLNFPIKRKQLNFIKKQETLKSKHLVSAFFKMVQRTKTNPPKKTYSFQQNKIESDPIISPTLTKTPVNLNPSYANRIISRNKTLANSINFPIIKNSVLSFDIQKVSYKKIGYSMSFNKGINPLSILNKPDTVPVSNKTKQRNSTAHQNIEIDQNKPLNQFSNLSKDDLLVLFSGLKTNNHSDHNGSKNPNFLNLKNLKNQNKLLKRSNSEEFNDLNQSISVASSILKNKSTSFSTANWLPNKKFLLNWYPKNSQIQTSGLFFIEQNPEINSFLSVSKKFGPLASSYAQKQTKNLVLFVKTETERTDLFKIHGPSKKNPLFLKKESTIRGTNSQKAFAAASPASKEKSNICKKNTFSSVASSCEAATLAHLRSSAAALASAPVARKNLVTNLIKLKTNNFIDTLSLIKEKKYKLNLNSSVNVINSLILKNLKLSFINKNFFTNKKFRKKKNFSKPSHPESFKHSFYSGELSSSLLRKELLKKIVGASLNDQIKKSSSVAASAARNNSPRPIKNPSKPFRGPLFLGTFSTNPFSGTDQKNKIDFFGSPRENKLKNKLVSKKVSKKTLTNVAKSQVLIYHLNKEQPLKSIHFGMRWKNPYNYKNIDFKNFLTKFYTNSKKLKIKPKNLVANKTNLLPKDDSNLQNPQGKDKKIPTHKILTIKKPNQIESKFNIDSINALFQQKDKKPPTRLFFTPQIFCQLNSTFSVILNQSETFCKFFNSELNPPLFYLINRQGLVKFFYISQPEKPYRKNFSLAHLRSSAARMTNCIPLKSFFLQKSRLNTLNAPMNHQKNCHQELKNPSTKILLSGRINPFKTKQRNSLEIRQTNPPRRLAHLRSSAAALGPKFLKMLWLQGISKTNKNSQICAEEDKIKGFQFFKNDKLKESINTFSQCYNVNQTIAQHTKFNFLIGALRVAASQLPAPLKELNFIKINRCCKPNQAVHIANSSAQVFLNKTLRLGKSFKFNISSRNKENIASFVRHITTPGHIYFYRFLFCSINFYNSSCLSLKSFSKKMIYMLIIQNKLSSKKNLYSSYAKCPSIFNISILRQNKKEKTFNKNILSPFIKLEIKKNSILNKSATKKWAALFATNLSLSKKLDSLTNPFIKNKNLCSKKDICQISENPRIQLKKLNSILSRFFYLREKSLKQINNVNQMKNVNKNLNLNLFLQQSSAAARAAALERRCASLEGRRPSLATKKIYSFHSQAHLNSDKSIKKTTRLAPLVAASNDLNLIPSTSRLAPPRTKLDCLKSNKNIGFQVKFGWVYVSKNLGSAPRKSFSLNKKFILAGKTLIDDLIFDNNSSYLEFIFLKKTQTKTNPSRKINIFAFKKLKSLENWNWVSNKQSRFIPSFIEFIGLVDCHDADLEDKKQPQLASCTTRASRKKDSFNHFSFGVLIRKVNEYKQSKLQDYKNEIYNFSNIKNKLIQYSINCHQTPSCASSYAKRFEKTFFNLNNKLDFSYNFKKENFNFIRSCAINREKHKKKLVRFAPERGANQYFNNINDLTNFLCRQFGKKTNGFSFAAASAAAATLQDKKQKELLNKKLFNKKFRASASLNYYYFLQRKLTNHLMFKIRKGLINLNQSILNNKSQLAHLRSSSCVSATLGHLPSRAARLKKSKNTFFFNPELNSLKALKILKKIAQLRSTNKIKKLSLIRKKWFINKSYSSMSLLHLQFKKSFMNKQKMTLQTISSFPNIDLKIFSNFKLYYLNKRFVYKTIFKIDPTKLNFKSKDFNSISLNQSINVAASAATSDANLNKKISKQTKSTKNITSQLKTNGISLPLFCRKPINFGAFLVSYKQPYGLNRKFNTSFSFFNYKNNLTFSLQKLNNSFYLSQFLENYILKLLVCQSKINSSSPNNSKKFSNSLNHRFEFLATNHVFYFSEFFKTSPLPLLISLEIISFIPIIFNSPHFSYNFIEKLERKFMESDNNGNRLANLLSDKRLKKLNLLSKNINFIPQINTQFFSSFGNKFSLSETIAKTSAYSSFEGEFIYKRDLNSFFYKKKKNKKKKNKKKKSSFISEKLFPIYNQNIALILTRQDLISFSFNPKHPSSDARKNKNLKKTFPTQNDSETSSQLVPEKKENYYINGFIIKFQKIHLAEQLPVGDQLSNSLESTRDSQKTNDENQRNYSFIPTKVKVSKLAVGLPSQLNKLALGGFFTNGDTIKDNLAVFKSGQIIHINQEKLTLRKAQPIFISPKAIFHKYHGDLIEPNSSVITLAYSQLKTGDIIQGIPKVEQFFEARTTKRGRLFRDSLPNLLKALFKRYVFKLPFEKAVRQSFYKIQQIIVDGVLRVYRSQGVSIADKHLEIIVKQMTSKVRISFAGVTGFFPGEVVDLDLVEHVNTYVTRKVQYEPLVLGITKASLEVNSFLSAASFQQTTRVLSKAALTRKRDFLRGLKENVILGNLIPAGTGLLIYLEKKKTIDSIL